MLQLGLVLVVGLAAVNVLPRLIASQLSSTLLPEASGGPFSRMDSEQCHAAADAVEDFPGPNADQARKLGLGLEADLEAARLQAAAAASLYADVARNVTAPSLAIELVAVTGRLDQAAATFDQPMTQSAFREEWRAVGKSIATLAARCRAIDRWIDAHLAE
jgi:hypothetical protein